MTSRKQYWVLIVGQQNRRRSPLAAGLLFFLAESKGLGEFLIVDSAGTQVNEAGAEPAEAIQSVAENHGFRLSHEARVIDPDDLEEFDEILALDQEAYDHLITLTSDRSLLQKVRLLSVHDPRPKKSAEVKLAQNPGEDQFEELYEHLWYCCRGFLKAVEE